MTIIALSGFATAGKDSVAYILTEHHGFTRVAFADELKATLYEQNPTIGIEDDLVIDGLNISNRCTNVQTLVDAFGWTGAKQFHEVRIQLQRLGEAVRNHVHADAWVDAAFRVIEDRRLERVVISDVRYVSEADYVAALGGYIVRVERPGVGPLNDHSSEIEMSEYAHFDTVINNNSSLEDLTAKVERVLEQLGIL